jgi:hypothetical protein
MLGTLRGAALELRQHKLVKVFNTIIRLELDHLISVVPRELQTRVDSLQMVPRVLQREQSMVQFRDNMLDEKYGRSAHCSITLVLTVFN